MMAVDILPASVPLDASRHFSKALEPYLAALIEEESNSQNHANTTKETSHQAALTRATIASAGVLAPKHSWLQYAVDQVDKAPPAQAATSASEPSSVTDSDVNTSDAVSPSGASSKPLQPTRRIKKKILMLGSGMVAQPVVDMIALNEGVELVIGKFYLFCRYLVFFSNTAFVDQQVIPFWNFKTSQDHISMLNTWSLMFRNLSRMWISSAMQMLSSGLFVFHSFSCYMRKK